MFILYTIRIYVYIYIRCKQIYVYIIFIYVIHVIFFPLAMKNAEPTAQDTGTKPGSQLWAATNLFKWTMSFPYVILYVKQTLDSF